MENLAPIEANHFLNALPDDDYALLRPHLRQMSFERGAMLLQQGEHADYVYFPQSGMISSVVVMANGEAAEASAIGREGAAGMLSALNGAPVTTRAVIQIPGKMKRIEAQTFRKYASESASITKLILRYTDAHLAQIQQVAACNALHNIVPRLCRWLLQTRDCVEGKFLPLTQEFLAEMLGVRRTTVTWAAKSLQSAGVIRYRRGRVEILKPSELHEMACECYDTIRANIDEALSRPLEQAADGT